MATYKPKFAQTSKTAYAQTTAANTTITGGSIDDTATLFTLTASGSSGEGARVTKISCVPTETVTAGVAYLYLSKDAGTTYRLIDAAAVAADTVSTTDAPTRVSFSIASASDPLVLEASDRLAVGFSLAKVIDWFCQYENFAS